METVRDYLDAVATALIGNASLCAAAQTSYGVPLLVTIGSWFGPDRELGIEHAPFVAVLPGDGDAELAVYRSGNPLPRAFELRVITGVPASVETVPPLPKSVDRFAPCVYAAGSAAGEKLHLAAVKTATEVANRLGLHASAASCVYNGASRWPLEVFDTVISVELPRTLSVGAF